MSKVENTAHRKSKELRVKYLFNGSPTCELCNSKVNIIGHHCAGRKGRNANHWVNIQLRCVRCEQVLHHRQETGNDERSIQVQKLNNVHIRLKMEAEKTG